jgi:hypothetical protein
MGLTLADAETKRWRVEMADKTARTIEARGFRVECGALVLVQPAGCAAAAQDYHGNNCNCEVSSSWRTNGLELNRRLKSRGIA